MVKSASLNDKASFKFGMVFGCFLVLMACGESEEEGRDAGVYDTSDVEDVRLDSETQKDVPDSNEDAMAVDASGDALAEACAPVLDRKQGLLEIEGDPDERESCMKVCEDACLRCDKLYKHMSFGEFAYIADYGPNGGEGLSTGGCMDRPSKSIDGVMSDESYEMNSYSCFCTVE